MKRRGVLLGTAALIGMRAARAETGRDRLVLLGTKGGPSLRDASQLPSSNLLVADGRPYLIDAGYGATQRLLQAGIDPAALLAVVITHHHSDHNLDLGPLIYNSWVNSRRGKLLVYGPAGIETLVEHTMQANAIDIGIREQDEGRPDPRTQVTVQTYADGPVFDDGSVRVTALRNNHPPIESYSLKWELRSGKVIVFSGDTTYFPSLADFARGADVLIHEAMYGPALDRLVQKNPSAATLMQHLRAAHTLTEDVGRIAAAAGVKLLVLNHFVPGRDVAVSDEEWVSGVRQSYAGPVVVGRDGLEIAF